MTTKIEVRAKDPTAKILLKSALKWIRRIEERAEDLPVSFLDNCDPKPLRKEIECYLKPNDPSSPARTPKKC
jgi:hypothetical protein